MVSTAVILSALATLAAALPSTSGTNPAIQRRQGDPGYAQCANTADNLITIWRLRCRSIAERREGSSCAHCCSHPTSSGDRTLDSVPQSNCRKASTGVELARVKPCTEALGDGYICEATFPEP
jgi:hypothetical protein